MAALNFPNNPAINDTYVANDTTWQFNGTSWVRINTGVQGVTGVQGTQGTQGMQGVQGTQGIQGVQGTQGIQGIQGTQGIQGSQGFNGTVGSQGTQGTQGIQGIQGTQGVQGVQGIQGLQGPTFARTNYSFTATAGQTTFSVTYNSSTNIDVYVNGAHLGPSDYTATNNTDIVLNDPLNAGDSVEISTYTSGGPQGAQGIQGSQGFGLQGIQGIQGAQGFNGTLGSQGAQGIQGATGSQGTQGSTGTQGIQGQLGNIFWATSAAGISTTSDVGINTTGLPASLTGVGNSFQGLYVSNGMVIMDNALNGNHYIGTAFNGLMAGPVTINGVLTIDGNYVVV